MTTPQRLGREATDAFKSIYRHEFGENLSDDEAVEMGLRLLNFLKFLLEGLAPPRTQPLAVD
jgi:hypothetical protein